MNDPVVSLGSLLRGEQPAITGESPVDLPGYADEILRSGFPGIRGLPEPARRVQLDSYLARIVQRELPENGIQVRRPAALKAWLAAYAAATSTDAAYSTILDAATAIPSFAPLKRLTHAPRHHLVDPALAARLVGVEKDALLRGEGSRLSIRPDTQTWLGALFESLVVQSVRACTPRPTARA